MNLLDAYKHMEWADARVWSVAKDYDDQRLRDLLFHLHMVQQAFLNLWLERPPSFPNPGDMPKVADVLPYARPYYAEVLAFLPNAQLDKPCQQPWAGEIAKSLGREPGTPTIEQTIFQVAMHSAYHRGQVNTRLRELGAEPPLVDFIAWIWMEKPEAEWA